MPRRGSLVGDAYVRIHADSSAVDNELRREFKAAAKKASKENADDYLQNFDKNIKAEAKRKLKGANEAIIRGIAGGKPEWDKQFKSSGMKSIDEFAKSVSDRMKRIAKATDGAGFKKLQQSLDELDDWAGGARIEAQAKKVAKAFAEQNKAFDSYQRNLNKPLGGDAMAKALKSQQRAFDSYERNITFSMKKIEKTILDQDRAWQTYGKNVGKALGGDAIEAAAKKTERAIEAQRKAFASYDTNVRYTAKRIEKTILDQDRAWQTYTENLKHNIDYKSLPALRRLLGGFRRLGRVDREIEPTFLRINNSIRRFERIFAGTGKKTSATIAKAFGKGSRNNFLNFAGGIAGGAARMATTLGSIPFKTVAGGFKLLSFTGDVAFQTVKGLGQLMSGNGGGGLADAFNTAKVGVSNFGKTVGSAFGSMAKSGAGAVIAIGAAVTGIAVAVPPLLSIIGSLAGAAVALVGSISIGIVGALLAFFPVLIAVGGGVGVLIGLITELQNIGKDTENKAFKPLQKVKREWQLFMKIFKGKPTQQFAKALAELAPLLRLLTPFITGFSDALYAITLRLATLFSAKDMQPFIKAFQKSLPKIFEDVGIGIADLLAAIIRFFKPILPYAERLAHGFERLMSAFNDWAGSAKGQNAIADFMKTAWDRANDVWGILVLIGEAIGGLFMAGDEAAGGSFLDSIKEGLQTFVDWINSPDGAAGLKVWFENSKQFITDLVTGIGDITDALKTINWQEAADNANTVIKFMTGLIAGVVIAISIINAHLKAVGIGWQAVGDIFITVWNVTFGPVLDKLLGAFSGLVRLIADMLDALANVPGFEWAKTAADKLRGAATAADAVADSVRNIPRSWEINIGLSGPGVKALQSSMARRHADVFFGASGGILTGPTFVRSNVVGGEAGREALVPLNRPLSLVDPSVRALSAFAQGLPMTQGASGGMLGGNGRSIVVEDGAIRVMAPNSNPELVASSVLDRLTAAAIR